MHTCLVKNSPGNTHGDDRVSPVVPLRLHADTNPRYLGPTGIQTYSYTVCDSLIKHTQSEYLGSLFGVSTCVLNRTQPGHTKTMGFKGVLRILKTNDQAVTMKAYGF